VDDAETAITRRVTPGGQRPASWTGRSSAVGPATGRHASDSAAGLSSLSFLAAALRRRARVWRTFALVGLLLGSGLFVAKPPAYHATAQVYLSLGPNEALNDAIDTNVALAQSRPVALAALKHLGLHESVSSLLGSYTVTPLTSQILTFTVKTSSGDLAVRSANALTAAFLQFRADQMRVYVQLVTAGASRQVTQAQAKAAPVAAQIGALNANGTTAAEKSKLILLQAQMNLLGAQENNARSTEQTVSASAATAIKDSQVLNPGAISGKSGKRTAVIYAVSGLFVGLILSMAVILIGALVSERLRARDDIALALGSPVRLSTGPVRLGRRSRRRPRLADANYPAVQRVATYLEDGLPEGAGAAALAIVPADRVEVPALATVALALACARRDKRVMIADLWPGAPMARLLGVTEPGLHPIEPAGPGSRMVVFVPARSDIGPTGPVPPAAPAEALARRTPASPELATAYASADLLLTLVSLEPMLGSDHLSTWADDVAVMVTAGRSTWARVQAVGEMTRLARVRLAAAVLVDSDQSDDSLGQAYAPETAPARRPADRRATRTDRDDVTPRNGTEVSLVAEGGPTGTPPSR
jgi:capsular polysaccharide biosynthesis protein